MEFDMKRFTSGLGGLLFLASGALTWLFMMLTLIHWWGGLGFIASFILTPGIFIFPIVFWIVEHDFPLLYFLIWGVGIVGLVIGAAADS